MQTPQAHEPAASPDPAIDPVCKMKVQPKRAAATVTHQGVPYYFCNPKCAEKFRADPDKYLAPVAAPPAIWGLAPVPRSG